MRWLTAVLAAVLSVTGLVGLVRGAPPARALEVGGRELTEDQIKKINERINKRRANTSSKKTPKGKLDPKKASTREVANIYKEAEAAYKAEQFPAAFEYFADVAACKEIPGAANYASKSRDYLLKMEKAASAKLEEAKMARLQGKGAEALEIIKLLLEKYPYCRAAEQANDLLITLSADPRVAAEVALLKAQELDKAAKYPEAAKAYAEVMKKFPDSVQALKAKLRLKNMKGDEEIGKLLEEAEKSAADNECPKMLIMGRNYVRNKMYAQARIIYEKLIRNYPDTEYAAQAKKALEEVKAAEKKAPAASPAG
ncbi:MAG: tetratricopeptide repeat protein [Planctomycetota bacterium]|jgi:tetratricopeptide (TPR) repeat protein